MTEPPESLAEAVEEMSMSGDVNKVVLSRSPGSTLSISSSTSTPGLRATASSALILAIGRPIGTIASPMAVSNVACATESDASVGP